MLEQKQKNWKQINKINILTSISDLTLRNFTCSSIISEGVNLNTLLNELQTTLDITAKVNSANNFTGLQTIDGNLKADLILVNTKTPVLISHLTSKKKRKKPAPAEYLPLQKEEGTIKHKKEEKRNRVASEHLQPTWPCPVW